MNTSLSPSVNYAGFWNRVLATVIDAIILAIIWVGLLFIDTFTGLSIPQNIINLIDALIVLLYFTLFESSKYQATLGKMALNIKVSDLNGNRISWFRAVGRYFGKILSGIILGIGYLMAAFTQRKQALHDIIAGTLVIKN